MAGDVLDGAMTSNIVLLQDLIGIVFILGAILFGAFLELTRQKICSLQQFTVGLSCVFVVVLYGGLLDHSISDETLLFGLYGMRGISQSRSTAVPSLTYVSWTVAIVLVVVLVSKLWFCNCKCCCIVGERARSHDGCRISRISALVPNYLVFFIILYTSMGVRLNARLRQSSIQPTGGTMHWSIMRSPMLLSLLHNFSILLLLLQHFINHVSCNKDSSSHSPQSKTSKFTDHTAQLEQLQQANLQIQAQTQALAELQQRCRLQQEELSKAAAEKEEREHFEKVKEQRALIEKTHSKHIRQGSSVPASRRIIRGAKKYSSHSAFSLWQERSKIAKANHGDVSAFISSDSETEIGASGMLDDDDMDMARLPLSPSSSHTITETSSWVGSDTETLDENQYMEEEWTEYFDEVSKSYYYYCERTGQASWDHPQRTYSKGLAISKAKWE